MSKIHQTILNYSNSLILLIYNLNYSFFCFISLCDQIRSAFDHCHAAMIKSAHQRVPIEIRIETICSELRQYCTLDSVRLQSLPSPSFSSLLMKIEPKEREDGVRMRPKRSGRNGLERREEEIVTRILKSQHNPIIVYVRCFFFARAISKKFLNTLLYSLCFNIIHILSFFC